MTRTTDHDPKCLAHGFGPGQRMDICICVGIRIGRADEREKWQQRLSECRQMRDAAREELAEVREAAKLLREGSYENYL